ncbi:MAG: hypothetical protein AAFY00_13820, partial [Bacteroidota bacterium]
PIMFHKREITLTTQNHMGVFNYLNQAYNKEAMLETLSLVQREAFESIPAWATAAFAIAVFSGFFASIALLLRKKWAKQLFTLSLIAAVTQFISWLFVSKAAEAFGPTAYLMPIIVVIIGVYLILFSGRGIQNGWLS